MLPVSTLAISPVQRGHRDDRRPIAASWDRREVATNDGRSTGVAGASGSKPRIAVPNRRWRSHARRELVNASWRILTAMIKFRDLELDEMRIDGGSRGARPHPRSGPRKMLGETFTGARSAADPCPARLAPSPRCTHSPSGAEDGRSAAEMTARAPPPTRPAGAIEKRLEAGMERSRRSKTLVLELELVVIEGAPQRLSSMSRAGRTRYCCVKNWKSAPFLRVIHGGVGVAHERPASRNRTDRG